MRRKVLSIALMISLLAGMMFGLTGCGPEKSETEQKNKRLADVVEIGDYVNYDANSGLIEPVTYKTDKSLTGGVTGITFSSEDSMKWRVLNADRKSGKIELISAAPTQNTIYFYGMVSYINAEDVLNDVGAVYGNGKGATGGRSINIDDIQQYSSYDTSTYSSDRSKYGETCKYTDGDYFVDIGDGSIEGGIKNTDEGYTGYIKATNTNPITAKNTSYLYKAQNYFENEKVFTMLFRNPVESNRTKEFWLASRCVDLDGHYENSKCCGFGIRYITNDYVKNSEMFWADGEINVVSPFGVTPVVSLESNIQTSGKDDSGAWNLKVD